jgi:hypothetical protein
VTQPADNPYGGNVLEDLEAAIDRCFARYGIPYEHRNFVVRTGEVLDLA